MEEKLAGIYKTKKGGKTIEKVCILYHPSAPAVTNYPYPILSYPILSYPILSYPTLPYPTLPYPTLPYPTLPYSTLPYSIPYMCDI